MEYGFPWLIELVKTQRDDPEAISLVVKGVKYISD